MGKILSSFTKNNSPFAVIIKTVDETVTSSTVLQNDNDLFFVAKANKIYIVEFRLIAEEGGGGLDTVWAIPSGTMFLNDGNWDNSAVADALPATTELGIAASGTDERAFQMHLWLRNGVTEGTVNFQWAQSVSNANATTVMAGSHIIVYESQ